MKTKKLLLFSIPLLASAAIIPLVSCNEKQQAAPHPILPNQPVDNSRNVIRFVTYKKEQNNQWNTGHICWAQIDDYWNIAQKPWKKWEANSIEQAGQYAKELYDYGKERGFCLRILFFDNNNNLIYNSW